MYLQLNKKKLKMCKGNFKITSQYLILYIMLDDFGLIIECIQKINRPPDNRVIIAKKNSLLGQSNTITCMLWWMN